MISRHIPVLLAMLLCSPAIAQDSSIVKHIPAGFINSVSSKADNISQQIDQHSVKILRRLQQQEARIKRRLEKRDSVKAKEIFGDIDQRYDRFKQRLDGTITNKPYIPSLDTLRSSIKFLQLNPQMLFSVKNGKVQLTNAIGKLSSVESQIQKTEEIKKFLRETRDRLRDQLSNLGFAKELKRLNKSVYYYHEQVREYKALLSDHNKIEQKALSLLNRTKPFKDFIQKHSVLASLFRIPGNVNDPVPQLNVAGLQTRAQINSLIQQQVGSSFAAQEQFHQNLQDAQGKLNELKDKLIKRGSGGSSDDEMAEGFKPNNQETKKFLEKNGIWSQFANAKSHQFFSCYQ